MNFADLGLGEALLKAIADCGYETPTAIQRQAIPRVIAGRDLLGSAQTGSGKTAGFALPLIEMLSRGRHRHRMARALVLEPTRELAAQVLEDFNVYSRFHNIRSVLLTGGVKIEAQKRALLKHMDVIIATPGRLLDIYERGRLLLPDIRYLVIDEADRMLDMGFIPDVERIVGVLPKDRQTLLFSATLDKQVRKIAAAFLRSPETISVTPPSTVAVTVVHQLAKTTRYKKAATLLRLIKDAEEQGGFNQAIVFCNRKRDIDPLVSSLKRDKINAAALHGDMSQPQRTRALEMFRTGKTDILVASDVAARGLDIDTVSHVFNYDVPLTVEDYVHRIGRTGRAGRSGEAITLATDAEAEQLDAIRLQLQKSNKEFGNALPRSEAGTPARRGSRPPQRTKQRPAPPPRKVGKVGKVGDGGGFGDWEVPNFLKVTLTPPEKPR